MSKKVGLYMSSLAFKDRFTNIVTESVFSLSALESKLVAYVKDPSAATQPFDASSIPKISRAQAAQEVARTSIRTNLSTPLLISCIGPSTLDTIGAPASKVADTPAAPSAAEKQSAYAQELQAVPEFSTYGPVLNSSATPSQLTESETEYQVNCVKHIFKEHVVFQVCLLALLIIASKLNVCTVQSL